MSAVQNIPTAQTCAIGASLLALIAPMAYIRAVKIVRTKRYTRDLKRIGASAADISALETAIASDPTVGDVIPGLGGLRKIRFGIGNKGKRGGGRAIYFVMIADDVAIMLFAYAKSEQEDLTRDQRKTALAILKELTDG